MNRLVRDEIGNVRVGDLCLTNEFSSIRHRQAGHKAQTKRDHIGGKARLAKSDDLLFHIVPEKSVALENNVCNHKFTSDPVLASEGPACAYGLMAVQHRFDRFGMCFGAADVDDAAATAREQTSIASKFDHVAGVEIAVRVDQRRRIAAKQAQRGVWRANVQGAIDHLQFDGATPLDITRRKAGKPVVHCEHDARLG